MSAYDLVDDLDQAGRELEPARPTRELSPVHDALANTLIDMLAMMRDLDGANIPAPMRALMRGMQAMRPMIIEGISERSPDEIVTMLLAVRARIDLVVDAGRPVDVTPRELPPLSVDYAALDAAEPRAIESADGGDDDGIADDAPIDRPSSDQLAAT